MALPETAQFQAQQTVRVLARGAFQKHRGAHFFYLFTFVQTLATTTAMAIVTALVLSDVLFTLRRLNIEADNGALRVLARARDYAMPLGITMIFIQLTPLLFLAYLYFR